MLLKLPNNCKSTFFLVFFAISACATSGYLGIKNTAEEHHLPFQAFEAENQFLPYVLIGSALTEKQTPRLHIYLHGDGLPWLDGGRRIAEDPSFGADLALYMMLKDRENAVFLGRPCYFQASLKPPCQAKYWTSARYGEQVLQTLSQAVQSLADEHPDQELVLIGFSGGATVAVLLAQRLPQIGAVVSVAGNLDTSMWAQQHGYLPLSQSYNPIEVFEQTHLFEQDPFEFTALVGGQDAVVPIQAQRQLVAKLNGRLLMFADYTHSCCWVENWPSILTQLQL